MSLTARFALSCRLRHPMQRPQRPFSSFGRGPLAASTEVTCSFSVLRLMRVEIHQAARKHGMSDEDIAHAYAHVLAWVEIGEDPTRYLVAGPNSAGNFSSWSS